MSALAATSAVSGHEPHSQDRAEDPLSKVRQCQGVCGHCPLYASRGRCHQRQHDVIRQARTERRYSWPPNSMGVPPALPGWQQNTTGVNSALPRARGFTRPLRHRLPRHDGEPSGPQCQMLNTTDKPAPTTPREPLQSPPSCIDRMAGLALSFVRARLEWGTLSALSTWMG
jgi:hypothetical protein